MTAMCYYMKQIIKEMQVKNEMHLCLSESKWDMRGESGTPQHKLVSSKGLRKSIS